MKNIITYKRIQSNYENVCYVNSIFALFLYLYINKGDDNTLFVTHADFEQLLKDSHLKNVIIVDTKLNGNWDSLAYKLNLLKYDISKFIDNKLFFGHDHLTYAFLFDLENGSVLEDGDGNYAGPIPRIKQWKRKIKGRVGCPLGYGDKISSIYLSKPSRINDEVIKRKSKIFDTSLMLEYTRKDSLKLIISNQLNSLSKNNILFTQPISDIIGEEEKIKLYKEIISEKNITAIKPHPRETTDYSKYFSCVILDKFIPAEVLVSPSDS